MECPRCIGMYRIAYVSKDDSLSLEVGNSILSSGLGMWSFGGSQRRFASFQA